jgi:hypothetical protein
MREEYNIYADESCHLPHSEGNVMALGAIWCAKNKAHDIFERIREIKTKHRLTPSYLKYEGFHKPRFEIKWNKISETKLAFYKDLVDFFFDDDHLHFRGLVVLNRHKVNVENSEPIYDSNYYQMYFVLLKVVLNPQHSHNIYIDIKDTRSKEKVEKLTARLRNNQLDFQKQIINSIQQVHSHDVELIQLTDLFTGALAYVHRNLNTSKAKSQLIERIRERSKYSLIKSTLPRETKFNLQVWDPEKGGGNG